MTDSYDITHRFWDEVFPMRAWTFQRSLELQDQYRWDNPLVAKIAFVYRRMDEILLAKTRKEFDDSGTIL